MNKESAAQTLWNLWSYSAAQELKLKSRTYIVLMFNTPKINLIEYKQRYFIILT